MNARRVLEMKIADIAGRSPYEPETVRAFIDACRAEAAAEALRDAERTMNGLADTTKIHARARAFSVASGVLRAMAEQAGEKASAPAPTATPSPTAMVFADGLTTLAPARAANVTPTGDELHLDIVATREEWDVWADELGVDSERTTDQGDSVTSHATWRGIHLEIRCRYTGGAR